MRKILFLLFLSLFGLVACQSNSNDLIDEQKAQPIVDLQGKPFRFADHRGQWIIVNYWASWCPTCIDEMPQLQAFYLKHRDTDAVVLGVNNFDNLDPKAIQQKLSQWHVEFPNTLQEIAPVFGLDVISVVPFTLVINPKGEIAKTYSGKLPLDKVEALIAKNRSV